MLDPDQIPPIDADEQLARFVVSRSEFRRNDNTPKPQLFLPYRYVELSVTRRREASEDEIWEVGRAVATQRDKKLYGRSDICASNCRVGPLVVVPKPISGNPNHSDIEGFPSDKADQMSLASKLAAEAGEVIPPPNSD